MVLPTRPAQGTESEVDILTVLLLGDDEDGVDEVLAPYLEGVT